MAFVKYSIPVDKAIRLARALPKGTEFILDDLIHDELKAMGPGDPGACGRAFYCDERRPAIANCLRTDSPALYRRI